MRHFFVPPKSRAVMRPWASSFSVIVTFSALMIAWRAPFLTRFQGTPQAASSRIALGAVLTNIRTTSWSAPQSLPLTVSSKWTSSLSPSPITELPRLACIPPWAAAEWERFGGTRVSRMTSCPRSFTPVAVRSPARPPPMTSTSV